jgi:hypothetical protein
MMLLYFSDDQDSINQWLSEVKSDLSKGTGKAIAIFHRLGRPYTPDNMPFICFG